MSWVPWVSWVLGVFSKRKGGQVAVTFQGKEWGVVPPNPPNPRKPVSRGVTAGLRSIFTLLAPFFWYSILNTPALIWTGLCFTETIYNKGFLEIRCDRTALIRQHGKK